MDKLSEYKDTAMGSLSSMWPDVMQVGANIAIAIVVLIVG